MEDVYVVPFTKKNIWFFRTANENGIVVVVRNWIGLFHFYCHSLVSKFLFQIVPVTLCVVVSHWSVVTFKFDST